MSSASEQIKGPPGMSTREASKPDSFDGVDTPDAEGGYPNLLGSTLNDNNDMERMGKTQVLRRNFRPLSAVSFTMILQGTWEVMIVASYTGLLDGGLAGIFYSYIWTFIGMSFVNVSLAEMASMAPTSGGQYHWVSEFSPPRFQQYLSHLTGWMSTISWQAGTASGPFLVGTLIQAQIQINNPDYAATNWQGTLLVIAITLVVWVSNVFCSRAMPMFQNIMLVVHVGGFLAIMIVWWALAPHNSAETVFTTFTDGGGWQTIGVSMMVGQISSIYALICSDAAAHMAEEIKDAGVAVPKAIIRSYLGNSLIGFIGLVTFLFVLTDLEGALDSETGWPHIWAFQQAVGLAGTNVLNFIMISLIFAGTISFNLSTSRQTWAFARDRGFPFSSWLSYVHPKLQVPANAVTFTSLFTIVLSLINIGSDVAFNAIISLNLVALMLTYTISIGCVLYRRIVHPELLPRARWSLGKWGIFVNGGGLLYSIFAFFWCFWPESKEATLEGFNWAVLMFIVLAIGSTLDYWFRAKKAFKGPVTIVRVSHLE